MAIELTVLEQRLMAVEVGVAEVKQRLGIPSGAPD